MSNYRSMAPHCQVLFSPVRKVRSQAPASRSVPVAAKNFKAPLIPSQSRTRVSGNSIENARKPLKRLDDSLESPDQFVKRFRMTRTVGQKNRTRIAGTTKVVWSNGQNECPIPIRVEWTFEPANRTRFLAIA